MKTKLTIRNCPLPIFRQVCPQMWDSLTPTATPAVRFCGECKQDVHLCTTDQETLNHARAGRCVAREMPDPSELPRMYVGRPIEIPSPTPQQEAALRLTHREGGINDALKNLGARHCCPNCGYPAPSWRAACRVCGRDFGRQSAADRPDA